jgi:4a-hydroxytetrahydrobiopterin dehydratase
MVEPITTQQFHDADGVADWDVVSGEACVRFRTGSFAAGVALIDEIGRLSDAANHHPDVDLRYADVTIRLKTHEIDALTHRDVELARRISAAARELGVRAEQVGTE